MQFIRVKNNHTCCNDLAIHKIKDNKQKTHTKVDFSKLEVLLTTTPHVLLNTWGVVDSKNVSLTTTPHVLLNTWGVVDSKNFH